MNYNDGVLTLHQSDISHYITCPEQFRQVNLLGGDMDEWEPSGEHRVETDAATVGTVLHAVIESDLTSKFDHLSDAQEFGRYKFGSLVAEYVRSGTEYRCETFGADPTKALKSLDILIESWFTSAERTYWLKRDPKGFELEWSFDVPFVTRQGDGFVRQVRLAGQADVLDKQENCLLDWKSASRDYQRWEKQRWSHQPTTYTFAAVSQGLIVPNGDGLVPFRFKVFVRGSKPVQAQTVEVWRGPGQWGWLTQLVNNIVDMLESNAKVWPLRDDHALCGPKWCPVWATCKGSFVTDEWT